MDRDEFINYVVKSYKQNPVSMGFIPKPRIERDFDLGRFFVLEDWSFIFIGSPKSEITPIFALYVDPGSRNVGVDNAVSLVNMLPPKKYRVRCIIGLSFWKRMGLLHISTHLNRKNKEIYVLEGILPKFSGNF